VAVVDWKDTIGWKYPYTGVNDPKYIKARDKLFSENGHGWWVNDGRGWNPKAKLPSEVTATYRNKS